MANILPAPFLHVLLILVATIISVHSDTSSNGEADDRKVYIVYMGSLPDENEYFPESHHQSILEEVLEGSLVQDSLVRSYKKSFNGFAAKLTEKEMQKLPDMEGIVSVFPSTTYYPQTTRSWDFMGFKETVKRNPTVESDVIIGIFDTGIWPESESFIDEGFGPAPKKWKGVCMGGENFTCNNKLIGARFYTGEVSARDFDGHGTHVSSVAAGSAVKDVSFFGMLKGTARGAVPSARIAMYKICNGWCTSQDILAGFDDAIADGVDFITTSIGCLFAEDLDKDAISIGSFHAMQKGVLTIHSAGFERQTKSTAPWVITAASSTIDRHLIDKVLLGSGDSLVGSALNTFKMNGTKFPLVYGENSTVSSCTYPLYQRACMESCVDRRKVKGKIIVCDSYYAAPFVKSQGVTGIINVDIFNNKGFGSFYPLPGSLLSISDGEKLKSYIRSTKNPVATISETVTVKDSQAPVATHDSAPGPNLIVPDILKPDISAPGREILAAYSPAAKLTYDKHDKRSLKYSVLSGTSISAPHVTGAAAYVKSFHPTWSPSAIKSALMTTAWVMNKTKDGEAEFAHGAGHIDPVKAVNAGLVYDAEIDDYVKLLCNLYNSTRVTIMTKSTCPKGAKGTAKEFNYPTMTALVDAGSSFNVEFPRTVTNVEPKGSTYKAKIIASDEIKISVTPDVLSFKSLGEKKSFVVKAVGKINSSSRVSASLVWSDGVHSVRSPIVVYTNSDS